MKEKIVHLPLATLLMTATLPISAQTTLPANNRAVAAASASAATSDAIEAYDTLNYIGLERAMKEIDAFKEKSQHIYQHYLYKKDIPYGLGSRETFDHFHNPKFSQPDGVFIFIHGGYWQGEVKNSYAFVGEKLLEKNIDLILIEYDLTKEHQLAGKTIPRVSMTALVNEVGRALDRIQTYLHDHNTSGKPVYLSGHSAGGHLAAMWKDHPVVNQAVFPISGLFDLAPIANTQKIGAALQLSSNEIMQLSPVRTIQPANATSLPLYLYYGADEQPELKEQSRHYMTGLQQNSHRVSLQEIPAANHFEILNRLFGHADSALLQRVATISTQHDVR